jgi:hypothetical protein
LDATSKDAVSDEKQVAANDSVESSDVGVSWRFFCEN